MVKKVMGMVMLLVIGVVFIGIGYFLNAKKRQVETYIDAPGTVISSEVTSYEKTSGSGSNKKRTTMYTPEISYSYTVDGQEYQGDSYSYLGTSSSSSRSRADRIVRNYPQGSSCTVYYDPANPSDSVLVKEATGLGAWLPTIFMGVGGLMVLGFVGQGVFVLLAVAGLITAGAMGAKALRGGTSGSSGTTSVSNQGDAGLPQMEEFDAQGRGGQIHE